MAHARMSFSCRYLSHDALAALKVVTPKLSVAVTLIAPIGLAARPCCQNASQCAATAANKSNCACPGGTNITLTSLAWRSSGAWSPRCQTSGTLPTGSRPTPTQCLPGPCGVGGCGLGGDPRPGTNGWNAPYDVAEPWLVVYRNETRLAGVPDIPVIITETGWCRDFCTEADRANWTVRAWRTWSGDAQLEAVCPFLLAGRQWWPKGFPWIAEDGVTRLQVFNATVSSLGGVLPLQVAARVVQRRGRHSPHSRRRRLQACCRGR